MRSESISIRELRRDLRKAERDLQRARLRLKKKLLAGASIESGRWTAELRLLPGREPGSKNPDDYELVVSNVQ